MPSIKKEYELVGISSDIVYKECLNIFKEIGGINITEKKIDNGTKSIMGFIPSIWGWGGFPFEILVSSVDDKVVLNISGTILQLAASPLTKKMDEFLNKLKVNLKTKYNYDFDFEKLTTFIPKKLSTLNKYQLLLLAFLILVVLLVFLGVFLSFLPKR